MPDNVLRLDREQVVAAGASEQQPPADLLAPGRQWSLRPWLQIGTIRSFQWRNVRLPVGSLPPALHGVRLLHLSDLHFHRRWHPALDEFTERIQRDPPELILITGDFVEDKFDHTHALPLVQRFLTRLHARCGIFAIHGNHDGDLLAPRLGAWGVRVITQQIEKVRINDAAIELVGMPGSDREDVTDEYLAAIPPKTAGLPRIVLSHYPDSLRRTEHVGADIFLAGHTHGGQVCLPRGIPMIRHDKLPPRLCRGVHRVGSTWLCVSRGMGFATWPIRAFCPAEVIEIRLGV